MSVILTQPIGSLQDEPFSYQDLLNVAIEFPQSPGAYFGNQQQTVTCVPSLLNPAVNWCASKATGAWDLTPYPITYGKPPHACTTCEPPPPEPPATATPEPSTLWLLVILLAVLLGARRQMRKSRDAQVRKVAQRVRWGAI